MLFPLVLGALGGSPIYLITPRYGPTFPPIDGLFMVLGGVLMAIVTYYGIRMSYRINEKIDGENFIERYTVLSVPIFVKFFVFSIPALLLLMAIVGISSKYAIWLKGSFSLILRIIFPFVFFLFYYLVSRSIKRYGELLEEE